MKALLCALVLCFAAFGQQPNSAATTQVLVFNQSAPPIGWLPFSPNVMVLIVPGSEDSSVAYLVTVKYEQGGVDRQWIGSVVRDQSEPSTVADFRYSAEPGQLTVLSVQVSPLQASGELHGVLSN